MGLRFRVTRAGDGIDEARSSIAGRSYLATAGNRLGKVVDRTAHEEQKGAYVYKTKIHGCNSGSASAAGSFRDGTGSQGK